MLVLELGAITYWQLLNAETWVRQFIIQTKKCTTYIYIYIYISITFYIS
jgi:hypothetical protein